MYGNCKNCNCKNSMFKLLLKVPVGVYSGLFSLAVLYLCLAPRPFGGFDGGGLFDFPGGDKVVHFIMFFALAVAYIVDYFKVAYPHHTRFDKVAALTLIAILIGGLIEVLQKFMGLGRSMDFFDWLADVAGAVCAMAVMQLFMLRKMRKAIGGKSRV